MLAGENAPRVKGSNFYKLTLLPEKRPELRWVPETTWDCSTDFRTLSGAVWRLFPGKAALKASSVGAKIVKVWPSFCCEACLFRSIISKRNISFLNPRAPKRCRSASDIISTGRREDSPDEKSKTTSYNSMIRYYTILWMVQFHTSFMLRPVFFCPSSPAGILDNILVLSFKLFITEQ